MSIANIVAGKQVLSVEFTDGEAAMAVLRRAGVELEQPCGGKGKCGKCRITITQYGASRSAKACRSFLYDDCRIEVSQEALPAEVETELFSPLSPIALAEKSFGFGIAADLGTTTLALSLWNLSSGERLGSIGQRSWQCSFGSDVISRIQYCQEHTDGLSLLATTIRRQLRSLCERLCAQYNIPYDGITLIRLSGNTVMQHLFCGLSPKEMQAAPYEPTEHFLADPLFSFSELGSVPVSLGPCAAGFFGADLTAGLLACDMNQRSGLSLLLDIGTNGELALGNREGIFCCSTATGPAFEGAELTSGMLSRPGAVRRILYREPGFCPEVIGGISPMGYCGSGLVDLCACLLQSGLADRSGRLLPREEVPETLRSYVSTDSNGNGCFHLTGENGPAFTAGDLRKLQLAKAAVASGIELLLQKAGAEPKDIETVFLAGGFGSALDPVSAAAIGLIPAALLSKLRCVGNVSLAGTEWMLGSSEARSQARLIVSQCRYFNLSESSSFSELYVKHLSF